MDGPRFGEDEASVFAAFGQWVVLHERNGRLLVDAVGEYSDIGDAMRALQAIGRHPTPIGGWKQNGDPLAYYPLDLSAWLDVAPDDESGLRPTVFRDVHRWAGWGAKKSG